jgi:hypothetical protein
LSWSPSAYSSKHTAQVDCPASRDFSRHEEGLLLLLLLLLLVFLAPKNAPGLSLLPCGGEDTPHVFWPKLIAPLMLQPRMLLLVVLSTCSCC